MSQVLKRAADRVVLTIYKEKTKPVGLQGQDIEVVLKKVNEFLYLSAILSVKSGWSKNEKRCTTIIKSYGYEAWIRIGITK